MNVRVLDLFTGTGSIKKVCEELNFNVVSLDIDPKFNPDVCADILTVDYQDMWKPGDFDIIWASPPCQMFSRARQCNIGKTINGETMTRATLERDTINIGVPLLRKTQEIIDYLKPQNFRGIGSGRGYNWRHIWWCKWRYQSIHWTREGIEQHTPFWCCGWFVQPSNTR